MSNELLFILSALADIIFVFFAARRGIEWLFGTIVANLILIGIFGAKLITVFGLVTNAGNVFYACVFLATHFILEQHGKRAGLNTIWYGVGFMFIFSLLSQVATRFTGLLVSDTANTAITDLFSFSIRIAVASILAYLFAQHVNISLYEWLKVRTQGRFLWLRSNGANIVAQLVDSLLFFCIAFFDLPGPLLVQTILVGWLIKSVVVLLGTPFLYLDEHFGRK
jgi:uncharacterized integral membrane protein (TIGR00697 family)